MRLILLTIFLVFTSAGALTAQERPNLLPEDWREVSGDNQMHERRFVSPNGSAWVSFFTSAAEPAPSGPGERVTYQRRSRKFTAVSGYRGDRIFYRKSNLACGGMRWHSIALEYPASAKRAMDPVVTKIAHGMNRYDNHRC